MVIYLRKYDDYYVSIMQFIFVLISRNSFNFIRLLCATLIFCSQNMKYFWKILSKISAEKKKPINKIAQKSA